MKMKSQKYYASGTVPKYNKQIVEKRGKIDAHVKIQ
jgi:hypothetical protein